MLGIYEQSTVYFFLVMIAGCKREVSPHQVHIEELNAQNEELRFETVGEKNAEVILRCESVVKNSSEGITVRPKPIEVLKGELSNDMLNSAGEKAKGIINHQ